MTTHTKKCKAATVAWKKYAAAWKKAYADAAVDAAAAAKCPACVAGK